MLDLQNNKKKHSILIVDNEEDTRLSITELIKINFGPDIKLVGAEDGAAGLSKISNQAFDCIITDLNLPKKNGLPFITAIRNSSFNEVTPVVIVSSHDQREGIASQFSFIESVGKPFEYQKLLDVLTKFIGSNRSTQRISANVYNKMINITQALISEITKEEVKFEGSPFYKKKEVALDRDLILEIRVELGKLKNNFAIAFATAELESFQNLTNFHKDKKPRELVNAFAQVIFNNVVEEQSRSKMKVSGMSLSDNGLKDKNGVVITLNNKFMNIDVFANAT